MHLIATGMKSSPLSKMFTPEQNVCMQSMELKNTGTVCCTLFFNAKIAARDVHIQLNQLLVTRSTHSCVCTTINTVTDLSCAPACCSVNSRRSIIAARLPLEATSELAMLPLTSDEIRACMTRVHARSLRLYSCSYVGTSYRKSGQGRLVPNRGKRQRLPRWGRSYGKYSCSDYI